MTPAQQQALAIITEELNHRLQTMGEEASGLYDYYARKLEAGVLLDECDYKAIKFLQASRGRWHRVWEIGAGVGQLGAMLAIEGFEVVSLDNSADRYAAMAAIRDRLVQSFPEVARRWVIRRETFAPVAEDTSRDVALGFCLPFTAPEEEYQTFRQNLLAFNAAVIDFSALFTAAAEGEDEVRAAAFGAEFGLAPPARLFTFSRYRRPGAWNVHLVETGGRRFPLRQ